MKDKRMKWEMQITDTYKVGDSKISRTHLVAIPSTKGDRIDILTEQGKYHYDITKKKWNKIRKNNGDTIAVIIKIQKGKIQLINKLI